MNDIETLEKKLNEIRQQAGLEPFWISDALRERAPATCAGILRNEIDHLESIRDNFNRNRQDVAV